MPENTYRLKIANNDSEFEVEGSKEFVDEMMEKFENLVNSISSQSLKPTSTASSKAKTSKQSNSGKMISVSEFIRQLKFKRHTDIVLGFAYYLEEYSGLSEFSNADINNCYYEAKMESSNTSQMFIHLIKRGHIMMAKSDKQKQKGKKLYTLTRSGSDFVASTLNSTEA